MLLLLASPASTLLAWLVMTHGRVVPGSIGVRLPGSPDDQPRQGRSSVRLGSSQRPHIGFGIVAIVGDVLYIILWLFFLALLARLVFDWVFVLSRGWEPSGPIVLVLEATYTVTDPPLKALRRVIPPLRIGQISLDMGFLILIIGVQIALSVVSRL